MTIYAYPKVNICFKIIGFLNNYCEIASRFVQIKNVNLYDSLEICESSTFKISGNFDCPMEENTIFKAKEALKSFLKSRAELSKSHINLGESYKTLDFFHIKVDKKIPSFAGLGGGSSNAASYLIAMNEILELDLERKDLLQIARCIGADVSFFVCGFSSANVFGIGDNVEFFSEKIPKLEIFTPPIQCSTKAVYDEYRAMKARGEVDFYKNVGALLAQNTASLLQENNISFLNDLYIPACKVYPKLAKYAKDGYFFSGSGSSFFRLID